MSSWTADYKFDPVCALEKIIVDPQYARLLTAAFVKRLHRIRQEERISCICFLQRTPGPLGALALASSLVIELDVPASICRLREWPRRPTLVGYHPTHLDRIAIIYDLLLSGQTVFRGAKFLHDQYGANAAAVVVLHDCGSHANLDLNGQIVKVWAIDPWVFHKRMETADMHDASKEVEGTLPNEDRTPLFVGKACLLDRKEGIDPTIGTEQEDSMPKKVQTPTSRIIKHLALKQALVRFADWAGWLPPVDPRIITTFLNHDNKVS